MLRAFISFDYDYDASLRDALKGQSLYPNSPFEFADWSVKEPFTGNWQAKVQERMRRTSVVIVLCGEHTDKAQGVAAELRIARALGKPYFLLAGYSDKKCQKPTTANQADKVYKWTWDNLKSLLAGRR